MRCAIFVALLHLTMWSVAASAQGEIDRSEIERDCGTDTGSTHFEACLSGKYRDVYEQKLAEKYNRIVAYLRSTSDDEIADRFINAQKAWIAYREATCELENEFAPFDHIGWARCFERMRDERMAYFDEHYDWPALKDNQR